MVKFLINNHKHSGKQPCFIVFENEVKHYIESNLPPKKQKAI